MVVESHDAPNNHSQKARRVSSATGSPWTSWASKHWTHLLVAPYLSQKEQCFERAGFSMLHVGQMIFGR